MADYPIEVKLAPKNSWFTPNESNAYYKTRYSRSKVAVHWWGGGEGADQHDNIVNYFLRQGAAGVKSVNYVVSDIKITCMVDAANVAWATQNGNPESVSIEFQPTLSDEGYKRGGFLIATLEKKFGKMELFGHKHWFATACPGTIDIGRLRREADAASGGTLPSTPVPAPIPTPQPSPAKQTVHLPATVKTWRAYKVGSAYRKDTSDQVGTLLPSKFGGLTYSVVENRGNVVVIDTESFGRVAIWVKDTEAQINTGAVQAGAPVAATGIVTFPANVPSWRVYKVGSGYRPNTSDQVGTILPATFGGLTYPIVQNLGNVVVIDTQSYGRVAAWVKDTEAIVR
jgi:N-acetylmuramoyl-L-alanine amidase